MSTTIEAAVTSGTLKIGGDLEVNRLGFGSMRLTGLGIWDEPKDPAQIVSVQNRYNVGDREHEKTLEYCEKHTIAFIPWSPVAAGKLTKNGGPLDRFAKQHDATVAQIAIAWLLHRSGVMLPIPGTSSVKHLEENVGSAGLRLSDEDWKKIEHAAKQ